MRLPWLFLSATGALVSAVTASPVEAANLMSWQFDASQNKLTFTTDAAVQPTAQIIPNPNRVVIDLPGVRLGGATMRDNFGGAIASARAGQVDANTTRLVIELAQGYTIDSQKVQIVGVNPTQWSVQLPTPQRVSQTGGNVAIPTTPNNQTYNPNFQITSSGFYVRLDDSTSEIVNIQRSGDRKTINIDLPDVKLPNSLTGRVLPVSRYGVSQVQFSQTGSSGARLTLSVDAASPDWQASVSRLGGVVLMPRGGLYAINNIPTPEPATPVIATPTQPVVSLPVPQPSNPAPPPPPVTRPTPPPSRPNPTPTPPPATKPSPSLPQINNSRIVVTIDPGHGGQDPGAVGIGGLKETDVVLPISLEVARILERQGVGVQLTRSSDRFVSLSGRTAMANRADTDLFVSIHANAVANRSSVNGTETFYFSSGRGLAQSIQESVIRRTKMYNRGVKQARFYVLRNTAMPAALVEVGFVTGNSDATKLSNPAFRDDMAEAIAEGILNYIKRNY
ncbi:MAG: N-acetylmuramoyl-L-alanine amidase [Jaaginema sp. PMC 1079.18]|nr:N-acetylmuramoyl-L-alanine amidase [Jaaginema sp. PMC 1080.18]MEC4851168.1 N-acetylmuramoyl-L-alanine amidase [Jaaginema sp. PMC 1079.18]MEC4868965.1 N-acetylmuramoyl-L-alanine amidase [Jaaginema sp. PMC 1078.18]